MVNRRSAAAWLLLLAASSPALGQRSGPVYGAGSVDLGGPSATGVASPGLGAPQQAPASPSMPLGYRGGHYPAQIARAPAEPTSTYSPGPVSQAIGQDCHATSACAFEECANPWRDNLSLFLGMDGSKEPADLGLNANLGVRFGFNWGMPLLEHAGLGMQVGAAMNYSRAAIRVFKYVDGTTDHFETFMTLGIFQRTCFGLNWGAAYDLRFDDYYDDYDTSQWRGQIGFELNPNNEIGVWGTLRDRTGDSFVGIPLTIRPLNQINFYWRHVWASEAVTRVWMGFTEEHSRFNLLLPPEPNARLPLSFGADFHVPLNESVALFGEAQFITPNDTGTVTATVGFAWYPGAARRAARSRFAPVLPVANHTSMPLDVR